MLNYQKSSAFELLIPQVLRVSQVHGIQPELGITVAPLDVDVRRLGAFVAEEEEPEALDQENRRHGGTVSWARSPLLTGEGATVLSLP
jgi:hypothetical protein